MDDVRITKIEIKMQLVDTDGVLCDKWCEYLKNEFQQEFVYAAIHVSCNADFSSYRVWSEEKEVSDSIVPWCDETWSSVIRKIIEEGWYRYGAYKSYLQCQRGCQNP
jgi:hypothetical protein